MPSQPIAVGGAVTLWLRRPGGGWALAHHDHNTATTTALSSLAQWWMGSPNVTGNPGAIGGPAYVALGTGTGTPSVADQFMFAEANGTRIAISFTDLVTTTTGLIAAQYSTTAAIGTWSEIGLWDSACGAATVGTGGVSSGATTLPLAAGAPAVSGGSTPGLYTTAYIDDGASSEYISISASASKGAASWTLQAALGFDHAAAVPIVVFNGALWAHASISPAVDKTSEDPAQLLVQWSAPFTAS